MDPLEQLGFALAGYGCTTCIGNSGPLDEPVAAGDRGARPRRRRRPVGQPQLRGPDPPARPGQLPRLAAARRGLRAGRPGRHRPHPRAARDRRRTAGRSSWPTSGRRPTRSGRSSARRSRRELFRATYATVFDGDDRWRALPIPAGDRYRLGPGVDLRRPAAVLRRRARRAGAGRATSSGPGSWPSSATRSRPTTSRPAGSIAPWSPAGQWLQAHGVAPLEFNSYGARRGHHEVMMRGTFANIRLRNALVEGKEGPVHGPPARRRGDVHLRRGDALRRRGRAARS